MKKKILPTAGNVKIKVEDCEYRFAISGLLMDDPTMVDWTSEPIPTIKPSHEITLVVKGPITIVRSTKSKKKRKRKRQSTNS